MNKNQEKIKEATEKENYAEETGEKETMQVLTGFKVTYVFDIADTDGSEEQLSVLVKGLSGNGKQEQEIYEKLKEIIGKEHTIKEVTGTASKGSYNLATGVISVREDLDYFHKIKTILHEYAHAIDFKMHPKPEISRNKRELIAESVAFVVSLRLGVNTSSYSMSYIQSWLKDKNELKAIADTVQKVAVTIINKLAESSDSAFSNLKEEK